MKINVPHIAKLANLTLKDGEIEKFEKQLSETLDMVKKLDELDTTAVEPTSQVTGLENITREDKTEQSLSQKEALSSALTTASGMFSVKGIFENE
jgi:aspartyl-tRNA(Asn)/glutamyl-tRNA(Gln) amidotransferase subunit C